VRLTVALADPDAPERALALTLLLERVAPNGAPYPHPALHWLLFWDEAFQRALDAAGLIGIRWSLSPLPADAEIAGDSLGGALALGARLLDACPGDHRRYAILCRYDPDAERLLPVEQFQEKYDAACAPSSPARGNWASRCPASRLSTPLPTPCASCAVNANAPASCAPASRCPSCPLARCCGGCSRAAIPSN
jgi:hypothetical protein